MKHLEETPWWVCDAEDTNFCAYVDTDSNYFNAEPILKHLYPNFEELDDKEKDDILEKIALKYENVITDYYDELARDCFNVDEHRLQMKTECVIRSAYFRATRRYAQWITKQEGIEKETLDIKGLEFMKANFPPILGRFFNDILKQVLKGANKAQIDAQLKDFKKQILGGDIPLAQLGNPTSVKKLDKYLEAKPRVGEMFSTVGKGAPAAVRATIAYNDLLRFWQLDKKHSLITQADKIKWIYLKDNPYKIEAIAFLDFDMPDKVVEFLDKFANRQKIFDSILLNKLEGFYNDLQWDLNLNPHLDLFESFEV